MGLIAKTVEKMRRRRHQRGLAKSLERARRHLSALAGADMRMTSFCMELDPDMCKIDVDKSDGGRQTMWIN